MDERLVQFDEKMQKTMNNLSEKLIIMEHRLQFSRWQTSMFRNRE